MPKRKCGPPGVLRRAYGDGVRTLEETLLSLLPPPSSSPEGCSCNGHLCFGASFLLRLEDGREYRRLLIRGFCVVSADTPRFGGACFGSDGPEWMQKQFRQNGNFLGIPAWCLPLGRIGDSMMNFLLNFTSAFVPMSNRTHHQIAGPLLNKIVDGSLFGTFAVLLSSRSKRRIHSYGVNEHAFGVTEIENTERADSLSCGRTITSPRQMLGLFHHLIHLQMKPERSDCSMFQTLPKVNHHTIICRKPIFYNSARSCSALLRNHILNQMKPNISGAVLLMKHILGISSENISTFSPFTCKSFGQANCLCHLLLKFLKTLIRNAKWCECLSLLQKHCFVRQNFLNDLLHENSLGTKRKHGQIYAKKIFRILLQS